jgi:hypothetical protein
VPVILVERISNDVEITKFKALYGDCTYPIIGKRWAAAARQGDFMVFSRKPRKLRFEDEELR